MVYWDPEYDIHPHDYEDDPEPSEDDCDDYEGAEALTAAERNPSMLRGW